MTIEKIIFRAATCNMGDATEQDGDNYRSWAKNVIRAQYPDADVIVSDDDKNCEVVVFGGRCDSESESEWIECHEFLAGLWDSCSWNGHEFE